MRIVVFLIPLRQGYGGQTDHHEIAKIMKSQGIAKAQAPPPIALPKLPASDGLNQADYESIDTTVSDLEFV